jgi:hypothetical protein
MDLGANLKKLIDITHTKNKKIPEGYQSAPEKYPKIKLEQYLMIKRLSNKLDGINDCLINL